MDENNKTNQQWSSTCHQLKQAFDAWADLSRSPVALSADEKRMQEMKELLSELKDKIAELSAEVAMKDESTEPNQK